MSRYLIDSDAIIDYLKGIASSIQLLQSLLRDGHTLATSDIVLAEVYAGLLPHERAAGERLLESLAFLSTSRQAARQAGDWRYAYSRRGTQVSLTDALIAATAQEHGAVVVTGNLRDYPMPDVTVQPLPRTQTLPP